MADKPKKEPAPKKAPEPTKPEEPTQEEKQSHRAGKPSNPFIARHPPPRLGRPVK
jgi:hypothetical protein